MPGPVWGCMCGVMHGVRCLRGAPLGDLRCPLTIHALQENEHAAIGQNQGLGIAPWARGAAPVVNSIEWRSCMQPPGHPGPPGTPYLERTGLFHQRHDLITQHLLNAAAGGGCHLDVEGRRCAHRGTPGSVPLWRQPISSIRFRIQGSPVVSRHVVLNLQCKAERQMPVRVLDTRGAWT